MTCKRRWIVRDEQSTLSSCDFVPGVRTYLQLWEYNFCVTVRTTSLGWTWHQNQRKSPTIRTYVVHVVKTPHLDLGNQLLSFTRIMSAFRISWPFLVESVHCFLRNLPRTLSKINTPEYPWVYVRKAPLPDNYNNTKRAWQFSVSLTNMWWPILVVVAAMYWPADILSRQASLSRTLTCCRSLIHRCIYHFKNPYVQMRVP